MTTTERPTTPTISPPRATCSEGWTPDARDPQPARLGRRRRSLLRPRLAGPGRSPARASTSPATSGACSRTATSAGSRSPTSSSPASCSSPSPSACGARWRVGPAAGWAADALTGSSAPASSPRASCPPTRRSASPSGRRRRVGTVTAHGIGHFAAAGIGFVAIAAACFVLARRFSGRGGRRLARLLAADRCRLPRPASSASPPALVASRPTSLFTGAVILVFYLDRRRRRPPLPARSPTDPPPEPSRQSLDRQEITMRYIIVLKGAQPAGPPPEGLMAAIMELGAEATASGRAARQRRARPECGRRPRHRRRRRACASWTARSPRPRSTSRYAVYDVRSKEEAIEWAVAFHAAARRPAGPAGRASRDVVKILGPEDFGPPP